MKRFNEYMPNMKKRISLQSLFSSPGFPRPEHWILLGIFILAILLRIHVDPNIPFHYDPGKNIVYARAALDWFPLIPQTNPYFNLGEYYEYQVLFPYLTAFLHNITGASLVQAATWIAIFSGAALTLTVYYFTIELFDNTTAALISAFLIAVSKIQLLQYMNYYPQILAMTLMPLSFLFLIRYIKSHEWKYVISVIILSSLIVLGSYLVALVYFTILLLSLAIWSFFDKRTVPTLILIPVSTILLLTFFWLPTVWRHGVQQIIETAVSIIFTTPGTFTNQPWTITTFLTLSYGAIIAIGAGIVAIFIIKKIQWDFRKVLLSAWLIVSFLLMASYLFKPILWVDRYFPFFDIAVVICAGGALYVIIKTINAIKTGPKYKGYLVLLVLIIPLFGAVHPGVAFGPWGYPSDFAMLGYMEQNLPPDSLVVAPPGIQGFWVSALSGARILGGESSQMLGEHYLGYQDSDIIINSEDIEQKMEYIRKFGVEYIFIPIHRDFSIIWNPHLEPEGIMLFQNETYFELEKTYHDSFGNTLLIKVREPVQPQYHVVTVNWVVTAIGYLISLVSLIGLIFLQRFMNSGKERGDT
jgi:hypothetical protein